MALIAGLGATVPAAADDPAYPFRDPRLSVDQRVDDLLGRLTLDEKISLLHQYEPAIPRLGIQAFRTGTEALHGVAWLGKATVFPQAIGLASTWDPALIEQVGSAVGDEARGFQQERPEGWGLNLWAPVVNLLRDPRWGRNEEGYSEDPYLTGSISTAYGDGLTGGDPDHLKTAPTLKHYLANNNEVHRATTSSDLRPRVRHEYDEAAFEPAIEADAATGVMSSYNLVNGRPNTVDPDLNDVVRSWTSRDLLNVTDAFAPGNLLPATQNYYPTLAEGDAAALKGASGDGAWLKFADARLGSGAARFTARVAGTASGTVEVRLGSPTGTLVGTAHTDGTASAYDYESVTSALTSAAQGRQDVYLVLSAGLRLSTFSLRRGRTAFAEASAG
ncbi:glycoside hydrolase family 3 N-terminal domain-containing protein [Streptomyces sp. NBC_00996]|uniref:glycoside hydrolase family 3 N-terminal domain-containing protein n=1 Tax=Streptomyces sp. NBC_00996 TaxID=2903710 RepID=UPI003863261C